MKKKYLLLLLPFLSLASCQEARSSTPYLSESNGVPVMYLDNSMHITYLLLSPFGSIENYEGISTKGKVSDKFYENCVILSADSGVQLPDASNVVSSVPGATFRGWAYYDPDNENVWPDYYSTVPASNGLALKAIFDGTTSSGGSAPVIPSDPLSWNVTALPDWIPNDGSTIFAWAWGGDAGNGKWYTLNLSYSGVDGNYSNVTGSFTGPSNIIGFNMARCVAGTTTPDWTATGDQDGRIYNKTGNVDIVNGVTSYASPAWEEYSYNP